jgi:hypothetical protein
MNAPDAGRIDREDRYYGVIETVGFAFALLNRRPYLVWLLIVIDVLTWVGVRITLVNPFSWLREYSDGVPGSSRIERSTEVELLQFVTWPLPTLISEGSAGAMIDGRQITVEANSVLSAAIIAVGVSLMGYLLMLYLAQVGRIVKDQPVNVSNLARDAFRATWVSLISALSFSGLVSFLALPFIVGGVAASVLGVDSTSLIVVSILIISGWLGMFFVFSFPAAALGVRSPFNALKLSYNLVQHHFLAVVGLFLVTAIIRIGAPQALSVFMDSKWSIPFAIVANAYVATGLAVSILLFFHQRSRHEPPVQIASAPVAAS